MQEDNRRLVAGEEAIPRATQHKRPCADCQWARTALNGWLGDMTADEWLQVAVGEVLVA